MDHTVNFKSVNDTASIYLRDKYKIKVGIYHDGKIMVSRNGKLIYDEKNPKYGGSRDGR